MATTRIMPLHVGKGRTESRAISDIIDYVANPKKTDNGRLITGYACDSRTADAEFLLAKRLDGFLEFNGNELLTGPGKISAEQAKLHAETEYEKYRVIQDRLYESDFDRFLMLEQEVNHKDEV